MPVRLIAISKLPIAVAESTLIGDRKIANRKSFTATGDLLKRPDAKI